MTLIRQLEVRNVRGIGPFGPDLNLDGASLMLLGENGTGKSSYVDALEYVLTRQSSSLDIGKRGLSWRQGGQNIASKLPPHIKLVISDNKGGEHSLSLSDDPAKLTGYLGAWIAKAQQGGFVLRRRTMLQFLEADPKERYDSLSSFLALDAYERFESAIKDCVQEWQDRVKKAQSQVAHYTGQLRQHLSLSTSVSSESVLKAFNELLTTAGRPGLKSLDEVSALQTTLENDLKKYDGREKAVKLEAFQNLLSELPPIEPILLGMQGLVQAIEHHQSLEQGLSRGFSASVLREGLTWIEQGDLADCPLCEHPFTDREAVMSRIRERLEANDDYIRSQKALETQRAAVKDGLEGLSRSLGQLVKAWENATEAKIPDELLSLQIIVNPLVSKYANLPSRDSVSQDLETFGALDLGRVQAFLRKEVGERLNRLPGLEGFRELSELHRLALVIVTNHAGLVTSQQQVASAQSNHAQAEHLSQLAMQARKEAVQQAVKEVATEANRLYALIHPGEDIGKAMLTVAQRGQGSLELTGSFHGRQEDPRLLYSESHIDTLGLCFFLAVRRLNATRYPDFKLLVLDDVLHSVDSAHRQKTAEMLLKEFNDHQMVITTHDPVWFQRFKEAVGRSGLKFQFQRIGAWSLTQGPQWGDHQAEYDFCKNNMATATPDELAVRAGRLMEELLQNLCEEMRISIPFRKSGRYELGVLWPPFYKEAKNHKGFFAKAQRVCETIDGSYWVRNEAGAHFNESPAPVQPAEAKAFAQAAVELTDLVKCKTCGRFIQVVEAPKDNWVCRCGCLVYQKKIAGTSAGT